MKLRRGITVLGIAVAATVASESSARAAQIFGQNFNSSSTTTDYVSATPNSGQFNSLNSTNAALGVSITAGALVFDRSAGTNSANFSRTTDFSPTPTVMTIQFDLNVNSAGTAATSAGVFQVGSPLTTNNSADGNTLVHSRIAFNTLASTNGFAVRDINASTNSGTFTGTQTVRWFINDSGSTQTYVAPTGATESIANDTFDVFVGTTQAFNDAAATTGTVPMTDFKFVLVGGNASFTFDNIAIDNTLVPEPTGLAVAGMAAAGLLSRRRRGVAAQPI